jgi:mRNA interferase RelE/StbE
MYKVTVHRRAARYLKKLPSNEKDNVKKALRKLSENPFGSREVKCMVGEWKGYYRIRLGNIRVIFWIDEEDKMIYVDHISPRGDVYK